MEQISHLLNEKNLLSEVTTSEPRPTDSKPKGSPNASGYDKVYLAKVLRIVHKSISAANSSNLTEAEASQRSEDWAELLWGDVPEHALEQSFRSAVHMHTSSFPVGVNEIVRAYEQLRKAGAIETPASKGSLGEGDAPALCERCHGSGREFKRDIDGKILGVGAICDHRELTAAEASLFAPKPKASNVVEMKQEAHS